MCNTAFVEVHEILEGIFLAQKSEETRLLMAIFIPPVGLILHTHSFFKQFRKAERGKTNFNFLTLAARRQELLTKV
jgi:hypothetical protein